jgi:thiosulfate dehydrogenase (quinone) large subunit
MLAHRVPNPGPRGESPKRWRAWMLHRGAGPLFGDNCTPAVWSFAVETTVLADPRADERPRSQTARPPHEDGTLEAGRALALLRMVVGFWFVKTLWTKVGFVTIGGVIPVPAASERWIAFLPRRLAEWAEINPLGWQRDFLLDVAIPNAPLFAHLTVFGEVAVGLGLLLGLLTRWAALGGIFLVTTYYLASAGVPFNQQGLHVLLTACLLVFLLAHAGRTWGLDGWRARR